jgi:hypothetical protein
MKFLKILANFEFIDLQDAMDIEHENGRMNQRDDEWTYDIWVEKQ